MGQSAEELTPGTTTGTTGTAGTTTPADIEATRSNLSRDIDELTDKVSPARVVERRKEATKSRIGSVRDKLMGSAHHATSSVHGTGSGVASTVSDRASGVAGSVSGGASHGLNAVESRAQGNPLAAGVVAFGVGMLVSALIPASEKEAEAAQRLTEAAKEHGQPLVDEAKSVGAEMGQDLKESAQQSAQEVKATAQESVQNVKEEGQSSAQNVKDDATR
jgi:gas vesicle protein